MHNMENIRTFTVLLDGTVECSGNCSLGRFGWLNLVDINERKSVCTALGSPLLCGGIMRRDSLVRDGRVCAEAQRQTKKG